ncbi:VanZ family protein [Agrococcus sp. KRD186]|uniref:VanZ family protein n=1 Tax=Agrococcus sp. KRD186 TaxID=2729730 RepID=UPI0019CFC76A|nr:VanZ family protein [Agrococcus sp. KRD186]
MPATAPVSVQAGANVVLVTRRVPAPLRRFGVAGLLLGVPALGVITLWPTHFLLRIKPRVVQGIEWLQARDMVEWLYWTRLEVLANVAMFLPLALLLILALGGRRWWIAVGLCVTLSLSVELTQYFMPGRVAAVQDVIANSVGALIGTLLGVVVEGVARRGRR